MPTSLGHVSAQPRQEPTTHPGPIQPGPTHPGPTHPGPIHPGEGTDVPPEDSGIDIHTTAGKLDDLHRRLDEARTGAVLPAAAAAAVFVGIGV